MKKRMRRESSARGRHGGRALRGGGPAIAAFIGLLLVGYTSWTLQRAGHAAPADEATSSAAERTPQVRVNLAYTINNLGYTDTCG